MPTRDPEKRREYDKKYYEANREKVNEKKRPRDRERYRKNREKELERCKKYKTANKERIAARNRVYYEAHKEEIRENKSRRMMIGGETLFFGSTRKQREKFIKELTDGKIN